YESKLQVDPPLSPQFKSRLMSLAGRIELNQLEMAHYEAQLIVRDFGTHVLKSVTAGAAIIKDDLFQRALLEHGSYSRTQMLSYARSSFYSWCGLRSSYGSVRSGGKDIDSEASTYGALVTESSIRAMGGPLMDPKTTSVSDWTSEVDTNLVPMDRSGDPLYYLINPHTLPELPEATAVEAAEYVRKAIQAYYEMNVIPGCRNKDLTERFSRFANIDDESCSTEPAQSHGFGGSFQTCEKEGDEVDNDPCEELKFPNVLTGGYSCPEGFKENFLHKGSRLGLLESERHCKRIVQLIDLEDTAALHVQNKHKEFFGRNPLASGLKKCPAGFSKQLATVNLGCEIYYCVVSWKLSGSALPPLRRPPFMMKPAVPIVEDDRKPNNTLVMVDMEAETWMQNQEALNLQQGITEGQSGHTQGLTPGAAA
ncbi:hypothetical protein RRG08_064263, partial [Elysia crispata]